MFEIDGFVRADNSDDTACGTCVGADPNLNRVCRGDAQEGGNNDFRFNADKSICQTEDQQIVVQQECVQNTDCTICGDPDINDAGGKTRITQLVFRWIPVGGLGRNDITASGAVSATPSTSVVLSNTDPSNDNVSIGAYVLVTVDGDPFDTNTDFRVGDTTVTLHT